MSRDPPETAPRIRSLPTSKAQLEVSVPMRHKSHKSRPPRSCLHQNSCTMSPLIQLNTCKHGAVSIRAMSEHQCANRPHHCSVRRFPVCYCFMPHGHIGVLAVLSSGRRMACVSSITVNCISSAESRSSCIRLHLFKPCNVVP